MRIGILIAVGLLAGVAFAEDPPVPSSAEPKDPALEKRVNTLVDTLNLTDETKTARVHDLVLNQYLALRQWQKEHEAELKVKGIKPEEKAAIIATRQPLHDKFVASLDAELTPEQVEAVKDGMTAGKVQFTYKGYLGAIPDLTDEQKAEVLDFLKQARELAIDGVSMEEKSDIFNKYKGKINNWLAAQGVDQKKKPKPPATQPEAK